MNELPQRFGRYRLEQRIARGGMADIYRAVAPMARGLDQVVAIKRIRADLRGQAELEGMFTQEARVALSLSHPNIVHTFDFGEVDGVLYLAMEYIDGVDVMRLLRAGSNGPGLGPEAVAWIGHEVASALAYLHDRVAAHRDVSPHNIMVDRHGRVRIVDFGIAAPVSATPHEPTIKGKIAYMSPEQARGEPLDARSDIRSLGVVLYELLTGHLLFRSADRSSALEAVRTRVPPPLREVAPGTPEPLGHIVTTALAHDRRERYGSAEQMRQELARWLGPGGIAVGATNAAAQVVAVGTTAEPTVLAVHPQALLEQLRTWFAESIRSGSITGVVEGASGMGHDVLISRFCAGLPADSCWVVHVRSPPGEPRPWVGWLRDVLPRPRPAGDDVDALVRHTEALCRQRPVVLVLERPPDWPAATVDVLRRWLDAVEHLPVFALMAVGSHHDADAPGLELPRIRRLRLRELSDEGVRLAVSRRITDPREAACVASISAAWVGGRAQWIHELLDAVEASGDVVPGEPGDARWVVRLPIPLPCPPTIEGALGAYLEQLPTDDRDVLRLAAVAGPFAHAHALEAVAGRSLQTALSRCVQRGDLVRDASDPQVLRFRIGVFRRVCLDTLRQTRQRVVEAMWVTRSHEAPIPADPALAHAQFSELLRYLPSDHPRRWSALGGLRTALQAGGRRREAIDTLAQMDAWARLHGTPEQRATATLDRLELELDSGGESAVVRALDDVRAALDVLRPIPPRIRRRRDALEARRLVRVGRPGAARRLARRTLADLAHGSQHLRGNFGLLRTLGDAAASVYALDVARLHYEEAMAGASERGERGAIARCLTELARLDHAAGRPAEALERLEQALRRACETPAWDVLVDIHGARGDILFDLGAREAAAIAFRRGLAQASAAGDVRRRARAALGLGRVAVVDGNLARARRWAGQALDLGTRNGDDPEVADAILLLEEVAQASGLGVPSPAEATFMVTPCGPRPPAALRRLLLRGREARSTDDVDAAILATRDALGMARSVGLVRPRIEVLTVLAGLLREADLVEQAGTAALEAHELAESFVAHLDPQLRDAFWSDPALASLW